MDIQTIKKDINISRIIDEVEEYIFLFENFGYKNQICLQGVNKFIDPYYGSRSMKEVDSEFTEYDFCVNLFPEMEYTNRIIEDLGLCRTRIMRMKSKTCLSYHYDPTPRILIPIITNPSCFLLIDKKAHYLKANGSAYLVDTTKWHTAINASFDSRTHLVGAIDGL